MIAPDVGGGFGVKITEYPEEILASWTSRKVGRAIKWTETRSEHLSSSIHGRDQIDFVKVGAKRDGTIVGLECIALADFGAYYTMLTPFIPSFTGFVISGCTRSRTSSSRPGACSRTRWPPTPPAAPAGRGHAPDRGDGRAARAELGMDSLEMRRKNFIPKEDFPAEVAIGIVYDSGDYHGSLDKLLAHVDLDAFRREQAELREQGHLPRDRVLDLDGDLRPGALARRRPERRRPAGRLLRVLARARARVRRRPSTRGTAPHGQGLDTSFAQIVADRLGITPDRSTSSHGDTGTGPFGLGTYGSRSLAVGGESIARSTVKVVDKAKGIVAHSSRRRPRTSSSPTGSSPSRARPTRA